MGEVIIGLWTGAASVMIVVGMIGTLFNNDELAIKLFALTWVSGLISLMMGLCYYLG